MDLQEKPKVDVMDYVLFFILPMLFMWFTILATFSEDNLLEGVLICWLASLSYAGFSIWHLVSKIRGR